MFAFVYQKSIIISLSLVLIVLPGISGCEAPEEDVTVEEEVEINNDIEEPDTLEEEEVDIDKDNPYDIAEEIVPVADANIALDEDFRDVLGETFEEKPKLITSGESPVLTYIVNRVITSDDVNKIRELLEKKDYEMIGTDIEGDLYRLVFRSELIEEEFWGDIAVQLWTTEEGENAQKVILREF